MSNLKHKLSDKQIGRLYDMIRKRSFYAVVAELHRAAGLSAGDNVPATADNWKDVHAALGCAVGLMDNQEIALRPPAETGPQPRGNRRIRLRV